MQPNEIQPKFSDEATLNLIRTKRNDLIKHFLLGNNLADYIVEKHKDTKTTPVRLEFMKRTLSELLISPVDLEHYGRLILDVRQTDNANSIMHQHEQLFYIDLERAIKNYLY